jgi:hypothetical protein
LKRRFGVVGFRKNKVNVIIRSVLRIGMVFGNKCMNIANPVLLIGVISVEIHLNEQVVVERSGSAARRFLACETRVI